VLGGNLWGGGGGGGGGGGHKLLGSVVGQSAVRELVVGLKFRAFSLRSFTQPGQCCD